MLTALHITTQVVEKTIVDCFPHSVLHKQLNQNKEATNDDGDN